MSTLVILSRYRRDGVKTDWLSKRPTSSSYSSALVTGMTGSDLRGFGAAFLTYLGATG
jgi:hypothetical protein